ncbi:hypothetical protein Goshw_017181 [Gossypium schwendimanii]|uniref:COBRA-like protein n=1 Tax=Gossypium schwendimanii TaxID=34291 RepID=A0A7J9KLX7_GOSSC|nr:hypothetical protein [Gossypium schwendimanii]
MHAHHQAKASHLSMHFQRFILVFSFTMMSSLAAYDLLDPNGSINIIWDIMSWKPDGYLATVRISNLQMYRLIRSPGWTIGWTWANKEVIWSMVGAQAIDQGDCSNFKTNIPHSCETSPAIVDLLPGSVPQNQQLPNCCKGGVLGSWGQRDNVESWTAMQHGARSMPLSRPAAIELSSLCLVRTNVTILAVHSSFFLAALLVFLFCFDYSCFCLQISLLYAAIVPTDKAATVSWFQASVGHSGTSRKTVKVPKGFYLLGPGAGYACSSAVVVPPSVFLSADGRRKTRAMSELGFTLSHVCDTGVFYGVKEGNELLMEAGKVQSEMIFGKDEKEFTLNQGWVFPRKVYFNGDECLMPPPNSYPFLPKSPNPIHPLLFASALLLILLAFCSFWCNSKIESQKTQRNGPQLLR